MCWHIEHILSNIVFRACAELRCASACSDVLSADVARVELSLRTGASNAADLADLTEGDTVHGTVKKVDLSLISKSTALTCVPDPILQIAMQSEPPQ